MRLYDTPGVYTERTDAAFRQIPSLRTDITGFVGIAARGPLHTPVPLESWHQFEAYFGGFTGQGYLAYAVRAFLENGGRRCWVVRVASEASSTAAVVLDYIDPSTKSRVPVWRIEAISPGVWGNDIEITVKETHRLQTFTSVRDNTLEYVTVLSNVGLERGSHVRLKQGGTTLTKAVRDVLHERHVRLVWINREDSPCPPYYVPLVGGDPSQKIYVESIEYTILVREAGILTRVYEGLSLIPEHSRYGPSILRPFRLPFQSERLKLPKAPEPIAIVELRDMGSITEIHPLELRHIDSAGKLDLNNATPFARSLNGGSDGLVALRAGNFIGEQVDPTDSDDVRRRKQQGLTALNTIDEVAIVAVPDIHIQPRNLPPVAPLPCNPDICLPGPPQLASLRPRSLGDLPPRFSDEEVYAVQSAMVTQCELLRDRIALLDPPYSAVKDEKLGSAAIRLWRTRFDSKYAALYYPWIKVSDPLRDKRALTLDIPPSGHVAGQYARADLEIGVHKAPANIPLQWIQDVTAMVGAAEHGVLHPIGINVIKPLPGRGIRIFGARTVSSDQDWRHVNVRRLLMMIEEAVEEAIQWAVFEPNEVFTRAKVALSLRSFLLTLWQGGALVGANPEEAFYVRCDDSNNPPAERANGKLLAEVGVAPSNPFEFVVLRVGRINNAFEIYEESVLATQGAF
jgi:phage tail sheath protein FI